MAFRLSSRRAGLVACTAGFALALAACGTTSDNNTSNQAGSAAPTGGSTASAKPGCENYAAYGDLSGKTVHIYTSIVAPEDKAHIDSYKDFENCTGAKIEYEGSKEFEAQLVVRVQSGNAPDIAFLPQPGLLQTLVRDTGKVVKAPDSVVKNVDEYYGEDWKKYGSVDGTFYAAPLGANVKSFVWYSPKMFKDNGWAIPQTWDEMIKLSDQIAAKGIKPWCAGFGSGDATGWPGTDWVEDVLLRTAGADVYDKWVTHQIPFNDPQIVKALDTVGQILKDPKYVNGGYGGVSSIATTTFQDGGLPILKGKCAMHRQANFYAANWPKGTTVAEDGDAFAFYLPPIDPAKGKPVLGAGEFVAAFSDRPEVQAFQAFLSSPTWSNKKAETTPGGGWFSANKGLDITKLASPIDQLSAKILQDKAAVFRFDGSDQMPGAVGAGTFWKEMTAWITGQNTQTTLNNIEKSWPKS